MPNICQGTTPTTTFTPVGLSKKPLHFINGMRRSGAEAFLERYKDFAFEPHPKQIEFAEDMFRLICSDIDTSKVTVIPGRPGISKTTIIQSLASYFCFHDNFCYRGSSAIGLIIVTDRLKRLAEYQKPPEDIQSVWGTIDGRQLAALEKYSTYLTSSGDKSATELLIASQYKPIVLLTTQRYFTMNDEQRALLFNYRDRKKESHRREIVIFDEKPYFYETKIFDVSNFNNCATALQNGIPENAKNSADKDWILSEYNHGFRPRMESILREKEKVAENVDRFFWHSEYSKNVTSNDDRFFKLVEKHKTTILAKYQHATTDLRAFKAIMEDGAFFTTTKKGQNQDYKTYFELLIDHRDKFFLGKEKAKFFVFDATANVDPDYDVDYINMINCDKYNVPLPMTINFADVSTSKNKLLCNTVASKQIALIRKTLASSCFKPELGNELVLTYQKLTNQFSANNRHVGHFGGVRGSNAFRDDQQMAHVGNNRFDGFLYFCKLMAVNPKIMEVLKSKSEDGSRKFIKEATKMFHGLFESDELNSIMFRSILSDFEQNIFRTAIRNYNNHEQVEVHVLWDYTMFGQLNELIEARYTPYDVKFRYNGVPSVIGKENTKERKSASGKPTTAQAILYWYEEQPRGQEFKLSTMLAELNISNDEFKNAKRNKTVMEMFSNNSDGKKGYYIIK